MNEVSVQPTTPLSAGTPAPAFRLHDTPDQTVAVNDFRGRPVVLAFYPADWSPVCSDQMALYQRGYAGIPEIQRASFSASPSTASGATPLSRGTAESAFHCWPTSSRRARSRAPMASIARAKG